MNEANPQGAILDDDEDTISILDLLLIVAENLKLLIIGPLVVGITALIISFFITPTFTAVTSIKPPEGRQFSASSALLDSLGGLGGMAASSLGGLKDPTQLYIAYLQSADLEDVLIANFRLQERYKQEYLVNTRKALEARVKITSDKKTGIIQIAVDDHDPKFAAELANAFVLELRLFTGRMALQEAQDRKEFLENQIKELSGRQFRDAFTQQAMIASLIREYEAARVDEDRVGPTFTQIDVAKPPELKSKPKRAQIAVIATLATGFLLLLFVFIRQAWRNMRTDPESEGKLEQILAALKEQWRGKKRKKQHKQEQ